MPPPPPRRSGFSLLEILVVLAMITLLATLSVINLSTVYDSADTVPAEEMLQMAVKESRYQAMRKKDIVYLTYNSKTSTFEVLDQEGYLLAALRTDHSEENPLEVNFQQIVPQQGLPTNLASVREPELTPISRVTFSPNLSSTPFIAQLKTAGETTAYRFDPFSNVRLDASSRL